MYIEVYDEGPRGREQVSEMFDAIVPAPATRRYAVSESHHYGCDPNDFESVRSGHELGGPVHSSRIGVGAKLQEPDVRLDRRSNQDQFRPIPGNEVLAGTKEFVL